jgi:Mrp family chromosome partitioning ATPase
MASNSGRSIGNVRARARSHARRTIFGIPRAAWMAARARNALRRPVFIAAVSVGAFVTTLVALIVVPQQARRDARELLPRAEERVDTTRYVLGVLEARARVTATDSGLQAARENAERLAAIADPVQLSPGATARRDSLAVISRQLTALLERAATAPLASSYRALADADALRDIHAVRVLLDSLDMIEREREAFSVVGPDPVFVSLSARANEIGRSLRIIAESRRTELRSEIAALTPPPPPTREMLATADTVPFLAALDSSRAAMTRALAELEQARTQDSAIRAREARAVHLANFSTPLPALLAAALVIGGALGFGAAFWQELRTPHLSDEREAERVSGIRALGTVRPQRPNPDRGRRLVDRAAPPYVDPGNDGHQLTWLHAATATQGLLVLTVTGEDPAVSAVVAANLAAISAEEARTTLLVDADPESGLVGAALRVGHTPGLSDVMREGASWSEAIVPVTVGRTGTFDLVPSGTAGRAPAYDELARTLRHEVGRLAKRYDTIIVVASAHYALAGLPTTLPEPHVICCVRPHATTIRSLRQMVDGLQRAGCNPLGVVVWDDESPTLPPLEVTSGRGSASPEMQPA